MRQIVYQGHCRTETSDSQGWQSQWAERREGEGGGKSQVLPPSPHPAPPHPHLRSGYLPTLSSRIYSCILTNYLFLFGLLELLSVTCNQECKFIQQRSILKDRRKHNLVPLRTDKFTINITSFQGRLLSQLQHLAFQLPTHSTTVFTSGLLNVRNSVTLKCENILGSTFFSLQPSRCTAALWDCAPFPQAIKGSSLLLVGRATHHECGKGKLALRHVTLPRLLTFHFLYSHCCFLYSSSVIYTKNSHWPITYFYNSVHIHFHFYTILLGLPCCSHGMYTFL